MASACVLLTTVIVAILALLAQVFLTPVLTAAGVFRTVAPLSDAFKAKCTQHYAAKVEGCEKISLHAESGLLYMACGSIEGRSRWLSGSAGIQSPNGANTDDISYLAVYDPSKPKDQAFHRVQLEGFDSSRTVAFHGMDVVPSAENKDEVFIYLVNHLAPLEGSAKDVSAYSSAIEVFVSSLGGHLARHLCTFSHDSILRRANDVVGAPDGKSIYFTTNYDPEEYTMPIYAIKQLVAPSMIVGYCHIDDGCKVALGGMGAPNGIVTSGNGTYYISSIFGPQGYVVAEQQEDNSLVYTELIPTEVLINDNLSMDEDGAIWVAAFPKAFDLDRAMKDTSLPVPSRAIKASINTGPDSFFGAKYLVETIAEDDGSFLSYITTVVHDSRRGKLFFHGLTTRALTECEYP
ncbi:hypothetical protein CYLTODRAFT_424840 [Cylindrobasidium torrendii FP15055 ss-10]|uniref:Calcium-dependent phosphotriesterase n=1 Tax=Cylindrobasidium torrendii FP15055 ss-10 TaxID=1314674 RepID=A0A0D7B3V6_9AGAR|nr:hypothetical protein CYLTODRAFT_424840 [Cylindrobasidium torrendii FP15055 ss-10]